MKLLDQVRKDYNERYTLVISKDHHRGIVVQVARMNPTHVADNNGEISTNHRPVVLFQRNIPLGVKTDGKDAEFYKKEEVGTKVALAINEANMFAAKCIEAESGVDEILTSIQNQFNGG